MRLRVAAFASFLLLVFVGAVALGSSGYFARLFIDGVEVASQELDPGTRDVRVVVDGPAGTLLDESFQVDVPEATQHLVIGSDTLIENETLTLRSGDSIEFRNGARLMFGEGASADWQGTPTTTWSDDGATQNLDRDVDIFGSGDIMFMAGSEPSILRFVEIDLQPIPEVDHYPLHWHHAGDGSRGTLVEGVVVKNSTNRAFVPHASHGITFRDTIAKDIVGPAYWWNPPPSQSPDTVNNSNDILYDHALADGVTNRVGDDRGFRLGAFVLGAGTGNTVRDSVALNVNPSHVKNCAGFNWPELNVNQPSVWTFQNNKTFGSRCNGIFVWQNDIDTHLVEGFTSTEPIEHGAYNNHYQYLDADVPGVIVHATGWGMDGGSIGDVTALRHRTEGDVTFENLTVDSLTISNAVDGGTVPAHYVFDGTTLACADVVWANVVVGTTVTIDGEPCTEGVPVAQFTESFNTADSDTLGPDLTWNELSGDWDVVSNQAQSVALDGSSLALARAEHDLDSDDHYAEADIIASSTEQAGVAVRVQDASNYYLGYWRGASDTYRIAKFVGGSFTLLSDTSGPSSISATMRLEVDGTDLELFIDDVSVLTASDSSLSGIVRTGLFAGGNAGAEFDNFETGDLAATPVTGTLAETEADDTLSASGTHTVPSFTGTVAETEEADTLSASGTHTPPAFTGSLAETEAADTLAASGTHTAPSYTGTLAETEELDTLAASGTFTPLAITGSLAETEEDDTLSAVGGDGRVIRFREVALTASAKSATVGASRKEATLS